MTRLEKDLAALATMSPALLRERWGLVDAGPALSVPAPLLRRLLAQRLQEKRHGALLLLVVRELERVASASGTIVEPVRRQVALTPGTRHPAHPRMEWPDYRGRGQREWLPLG